MADEYMPTAREVIDLMRKSDVAIEKSTKLLEHLNDSIGKGVTRLQALADRDEPATSLELMAVCLILTGPPKPD